MSRPGFQIELDLVRARGDRRLYLLEGIGAIRLEGVLMRAATAESGAAAWQFARRGFWQRSIAATGRDGRVVGTFDPRDIRRGGRLRWHAHDYALRPDSVVRERYALTSEDRELAVLEARGWWGWGTRTPLTLRLADRAAGLDAGLLLFASFIVRAIASDASANAAGAATVATTTSAN